MRVAAGKVINLGPISLQAAKVYFSVANEIVPVKHQLGSDSVAVLIAEKDQTCDIWAAPGSNTKSSIAVVCDTANVRAALLLVALHLSDR